MHLVRFGTTGLRVSQLALGTMTFGSSWPIGASSDASEEMLRAYLDAGGNFLDTADKYTDGESEAILGRLLKGIRRRLVVGTKYSLFTSADDPNSLGNHRRNLVLSVEDSLRRLQTDYVDILWVHAWYFESLVDDVARAIDDVIASGKVMFWGMSDTPAWVAAEASTVARLRGWAPLSAIQVGYSLCERTPERELLPFARHHALGVTGWAPLAGGFLTAKHHGSGIVDSRRSDRAGAMRSGQNDAIVNGIVEIGERHGRSASQVALAWILQRQPGLVPIVGARSVTQLAENLQAASLCLSDDEVSRLNQLSAISLGFPHDMIRGARMQEVMFGPHAKSSSIAVGPHCEGLP